ncbi:MAG TPA: AF1514 family protein [Burkholderiales bacterium]
MKTLHLHPQPPCPGLNAALKLAKAEADGHLGAPMLLSWYDRDRDFESPQHASECHADGAVPGYVDYALHRGASLKVDVEDGRFVFFYLDADL